MPAKGMLLHMYITQTAKFKFGSQYQCMIECFSSQKVFHENNVKQEIMQMTSKNISQPLSTLWSKNADEYYRVYTCTIVAKHS